MAAHSLSQTRTANPVGRLEFYKVNIWRVFECRVEGVSSLWFRRHLDKSAPQGSLINILAHYTTQTHRQTFRTWAASRLWFGQRLYIILYEMYTWIRIEGVPGIYLQQILRWRGHKRDLFQNVTLTDPLHWNWMLPWYLFVMQDLRLSH